ncbi:MAG: hypothetical protein B7X58_13260, partial [Marinobacter sp. 34-60-7]
ADGGAGQRQRHQAENLDEKLAEFYSSLLKSEARHYQDYLKLAVQANGGPVDDRVETFMEIDKRLIEEPDTEFRFHSGPVAA